MNHKKTGITVIVCIFVCLIGLWGSIVGSLRYGMGDKSLEHLAKEWELSQMQITKIASYMSMAEFLVVMAENPEITAEGTRKLLDAEYTKEFIADKLKDYRDDFLYDLDTGNISFAEIEDLYEIHQEEISQDLQYCINSEDLQKYNMVWENLAITERSDIDYYRSDNPFLFGLARVILSKWFLFILFFLLIGAYILNWYIHGKSFKGYNMLGMTMAVVGIIDCSMAALRDSAASTINRVLDIRSNLMILALTPIRNSLFILGPIFIIIGVFTIILGVYVMDR